MPGDLKEWITHLGLSPIMIITAMMFIYVVLGTVMEEGLLIAFPQLSLWLAISDEVGRWRRRACASHQTIAVSARAGRAKRQV